VTAPANANSAPIPEPIGGFIDLTVNDVRYGAGGDCVDTPVRIEVQTPDDMAYFEYDFVSNYDGPTSWPDEISGTGDWSDVIGDSFIVCPEFDSPGVYQGRLFVTFYDFDDQPITDAYATDSFRVSAYTPQHRLYTSKVASGAHGWTLRSLVKRDGHVWRNHRVVVQRKYSGAWHRVATKYTNTYGRANFGVVPARGAAKPYRVVSAAGSGAPTKVSPTYWLKRR